jgi:Lipocalin-like domain
MPSVLAVFVAVLALVAPASALAQSPAVDRALVGTWTLVSTEEGVESAEPTRALTPRGLLVFDAAGWAFEAISQRQRPTPAPALTEAQQAFANYVGSWGRYTANAATRQLVLKTEGALSPSAMGREFTRSYALEGDRLVITSRPGEPHQRGATRWTWERVPVVENLSPAYRATVGFWQHVVEKRVNVTRKTEVATTRASSVVVYTPSGYVGVYFPPLGRKPFAGDTPTDAEAKEALRGYVGYFGALGVYPGMVFHHILGSSGTLTNSTLKRFLDLSPGGDQANLRFPEGRNQQGESTTTLVTLKRLSGAAAMLGE